jgi:peptide/nickel transport system substrate-binding protein
MKSGGYVMKLSRRALLRAGAAAATVVTAPAIAQATKTFVFIPSSDLLGVDPIWTTAYVVRNHGT